MGNKLVCEGAHVVQPILHHQYGSCEEVAVNSNSVHEKGGALGRRDVISCGWDC